MDYKRLTRKDERGFYHYNCTEKDQEDCLIYENCGECYGTQVLYRLAELEDKIEQGTLIELPCKVGDKFYGICDFEIFEYTTLAIKLVKEHKMCLCTVYDIEFILGEDAFLTREEAEKRLKELQDA